MSAFAWWEWLTLGAFLMLAYAIGHNAGRASAPRAAFLEITKRMTKVAELMEEIADKNNRGADKMNQVCDLFRATALVLDKVSARMRGDT